MNNNDYDNFLQRKSIENKIINILMIILMVSAISLLKILAVVNEKNNIYNTKKIFIFHLIYMVLGWTTMKFILRQNEKSLKKIILMMTIGVLILLILVLFIGPSINGTKRWLSLMGMTIQPSCFFLLLYPYLNSQLLLKKKYYKLLGLLVLVLFLFMMEPDFGSSLLLSSIWIVQCFYWDQLSKFKKYFLVLSPVFGGFLIIKGWYAIERIKFIFKPTDEINQTNLAIKAIKFSGILGTKKSIYIPEMHNDYFFSAFTNLYGLIPSILLLYLWMSFLYYLLEGIKAQKKFFYSSIMVGSTCLLGGQSFLHIFTNVNLIPAKGISFPLISAGGSLMIANLMTIGIYLYCLKKNSDDGTITKINS